MENILIETYKDVPGWEGLYQVSNIGNVKGKKCNLTPSLNMFGYKFVTLKNRPTQRRKDYKVHQLVAMAFLNHTPCGTKIVIDHIDSNPLNNNVENLRLVTNRENCSKERANKREYPVGVYKVKRKDDGESYVARIQINKQDIYIGTYRTVEAAHEAYKNKLKQI